MNFKWWDHWPVGYLHNVVKELNSGLLRTNPESSRWEDLNQEPPDKFQIQRPKPLGHAASSWACKEVDAYLLWLLLWQKYYG